MIPAFVFTAIANSPLLAVVLMGVVLGGFQVAMNISKRYRSDFSQGTPLVRLPGLAG